MSARYLAENVKSKTLPYHLLFWAGIYLFWVALFRSYSFALTKTITIEFCYLIFITGDYYLINSLLIPRFLLKVKYVSFASLTLLVIAISSWFRALVAWQMSIHIFHMAPPIDFGVLYFNSVINISIWVLLITIGKMLLDRVNTQRSLELIDKERVKNELDYLKAQINPHALFNSLNTIYGNIDKNNKSARNVLLQFSELLRYQLYDCNAEKVSLEKEIKYVENYIAFQRLRKDENLLVRLQTEIRETGLTIAPLLLVVLIENAFKFVSNFSGQKNEIIIIINARDRVLRSSIMNTLDQNRNDNIEKSSGIGIANLTRRLDLLYNDKYAFDTYHSGGHYETHLTIDLS